MEGSPPPPPPLMTAPPTTEPLAAAGVEEKPLPAIGDSPPSPLPLQTTPAQDPEDGVVLSDAPTPAAESLPSPFDPALNTTATTVNATVDPVAAEVPVVVESRPNPAGTLRRRTTTGSNASRPSPILLAAPDVPEKDLRLESRGSGGAPAYGSRTSSAAASLASKDGLEWAEIADPQTERIFYVNTKSGECTWERPHGVELRPRDPNGEWWELFDDQHQLPYYYNTKTAVTEWKRPRHGTILSLVAMQKLSLAVPVGAHHPQLRKSEVDVSSHRDLVGNLPQIGAATSPTRKNTVHLSLLHDDTTAYGTNFSQHASNLKVDSMADARDVRISSSQPDLIGGMMPGSPQSNRSLPEELQKDIVQFKIEGFAKQFFSTHKKGIFRKKVPVDKMIKWTKDSISLPLLLLNKTLHKEALNTFKLIQKIMGDRGTVAKGKSTSDLIQNILQVGIVRGELRDEIFCQLCKQLTDNPRKESVYKGWELMSSILIAFPPSKNFEAYLRSYMESHISENDTKLTTFARHCVVKLERISKKGPRGKVPTIAEIDRAKEAPFSPSLFGESLADIMRYQEEKRPGLKVPYIFTFLTESILKLNGCATEGIFRVPGDADAVTDLRLRVEKENYDISGIDDASVPGSLFKLWLRELAEPIVPTELYDYCTINYDNPEKALRIFELIPRYSRNVLIALIRFLRIVADPKNQPITKMSENNIAMVFAPNILRCPSENLQVVLENTKYEQCFVRILLQHLPPDLQPE